MKLKQKDSFTCPFCLHSFLQSEALYRCVALPQICRPEQDDIFDGFFDVAPEKRGRVFEGQSRQIRKLSLSSFQTTQVKCDMCATKTNAQVCPHCHGDLPEDFFSMVHVPFALQADNEEVPNLFVAGLLEKLGKITGHDIQATIEKVPLMNGFIFSFDKSSFGSKRVLVSFHTLNNIENEENKKSLKAALVFLEATTLFGDKDVSFAYKDIENISNDLMSGAILGINFYNIDDYYGYFAKTSAVVDSPDFRDGYQNLCGEYVSQEILTLFGAAYGVNFLRQIRQNIKPWRFGVCSLRDNHNVPLASYHRIEDLFLWQLHYVLEKGI
ncbi:MAG: hypothetical protein CMO49_01305 [Verrucomicrobiales bacterium]|nr:hypothetical protein [Verrucomicrobiales bacterium]|tara:strand:- start:14512 stop:15489 length:978 start_codon:yes stop_codon:yes gene_type:complete